MAKKTTKNSTATRPQLRVVPVPVRQSLTGLSDAEAIELKELIRKMTGSKVSIKKPRPPRPRRRSDDDLPPAA